MRGRYQETGDEGFVTGTVGVAVREPRWEKGHVDVSDSPRPGSPGRQRLQKGQIKRDEQVLRVTVRLSRSRQDPVRGEVNTPRPRGKTLGGELVQGGDRCESQVQVHG